MADDEVMRDEESGDHPFEAAGPRRSTFTPPPAAPAAEPEAAVEQPVPTIDDDAYDDDALANALAEENVRITTSAIPIIGPTTLPEIPFDPEPEPAPAPSEPAEAAPPAWANAPAPSPELIVDVGLPHRPVRRSLPDEQLMQTLDEAAREPGSSLNVIEHLESQMRLREQEAREYRAWESTMLSVGTPDAIAAVEATRPEFAGVLASSEPITDRESQKEYVEAPAIDEPTEHTERETEEAEPAERAAEHDTVEPPIIRTPAFVDDSAASSPFPPPEAQPESEAAPEPEPAPEPQPDERQREPESEHRPDEGQSPRAPHPEPKPEEDPEPALGLAVESELEPQPVLEEATERQPESEAEPEQQAELAPEPELPFAPRSATESHLDSGFTFEDLIDDPNDHHVVRTPDAAPIGPPPLVEPLPVMNGEQVPVETGSVSLAHQVYDEEFPDDVDETDRAFDDLLGSPAVASDGVAVVPTPVSAPSQPIQIVRIPSDELVVQDNEPHRLPVFSLELAGLEPTPIENRVGRAARLFWLWFAANSSVISIAVGAVLLSLGMNLRQSIVAVLVGVVLSIPLLGLGTLAGKRTGQPTMVVSRATFGLIGNVLPASIALITRLFWGGVLLWLLSSSVAAVLIGAEVSGSLSEFQLTIIALALSFLVALLVAFFGYSLLAELQLVLGIISAALVVGFIALTAQYVDMSAALSTPDGPWILSLTGAVLVFSFVGLAWANSSGDLARYQRVNSSEGAAMIGASFGAAVPAFVLIGYGALLAASNRGLALGLVDSPIETIAMILPSWYPVPLVAAVALSLLSGVIITIYSGGFALQAVGVRVRREWSIVIVGVALLGVTVLLFLGVPGGLESMLRDVATTLAVPTAAWAGLFIAEVMIRSRVHSDSLLRRGGVYPDVRWVNLAALVVASAIGFGLTSATVSWLSWQGYIFSMFGVPLSTNVAATDLGVIVALIIGLLTPIVAGVPAIRREEELRV